MIVVMPGLDPGIHVDGVWGVGKIRGSSPRM